MRHGRSIPTAPFTTSPSVIADWLLTLSENAYRIGYATTAEHLLQLAHTAGDETSAQRRFANRKRPPQAPASERTVAGDA